MSCCTEGQRTELGWGCAAREVQGALHRGWEYLRTRGEGRAGNAGGRWGGTERASGWGDAGC